MYRAAKNDGNRCTKVDLAVPVVLCPYIPLRSVRPFSLCLPSIAMLRLVLLGSRSLVELEMSVSAALLYLLPLPLLRVADRWSLFTVPLVNFFVASRLNKSPDFAAALRTANQFLLGTKI
jgi:hypothetical protein